MGKSLRAKILETLAKQSMSAIQLAEKLKTKTRFLRLAKLEEEGLIEYDLALEKWRLK